MLKNFMIKKNKQLLLPDSIVSIILITHNDENIIEDILQNIVQVLSKEYHYYEIIIVDNYSEDNTIEQIKRHYQKNQHVRILKLSKTYNTEIALTAGLDSCIGDYVVLFNIYTDPPSVIPLLINKLLYNHDIVIGRYPENLKRKDFLSKLFLSIIKRLSSHDIYYESKYLVGLNRKTVNSITRVRRRSRNFGYINNLIGYETTFIEYKPLKNHLSKLKDENFIEMIWRITDIIISNSYRPMRILVALGMLISLAFLIYVFIIALLTITLNQSFAPKGWISISSVMGTMFFLLFSLLTLISEYLIRVLDESRNEPLYFIAEEIDESIFPVEKNKLNVI